MICLNLLNNSTNIMEMIMPLIKLKGMTPDTITIFTLLSTSPKLNMEVTQNNLRCSKQ